MALRLSTKEQRRYLYGLLERLQIDADDHDLIIVDARTGEITQFKQWARSLQVLEASRVLDCVISVVEALVRNGLMPPPKPRVPERTRYVVTETIPGINRAKALEVLNEAGYETSTGGVCSTTLCLVIGEGSKGQAKRAKAKELGVEVIRARDMECFKPYYAKASNQGEAQ